MTGASREVQHHLDGGHSDRRDRRRRDVTGDPPAHPGTGSGAGFPVRPAERMVSRDVAARNFCPVSGAVSASSVVSHTDPVHAPSAPKAPDAAICLPVTIPPAANTGILLPM